MYHSTRGQATRAMREEALKRTSQAFLAQLAGGAKNHSRPLASWVGCAELQRLLLPTTLQARQVVDERGSGARGVR